MLRIGITDHFLTPTADARRGPVALLGFTGFAVELLNLSVVDLVTECPFYCSEVCAVAVARQLHAMLTILLPLLG